MRNAGQTGPDHAAILATLDRSTPFVPGSTPPGVVVRLTGVVRPGPSGPLRARHSGRPCVWYRAVEVPFRPFSVFAWRGSSGTGPLPTVPSDQGFGPPAYGDDESAVPFTVDVPGGSVLVDPARGDVDATLVTVDTANTEPGASPIRREWIIEAGTPVFVLGLTGTVDAATVVHATPQDCLVVSTRGEAVAVQRSVTVAGAGPLSPPSPWS